MKMTKKLQIGIALGLFMLLVGSGILVVLVNQPETPLSNTAFPPAPTLALTPPPSLAELAKQYPDLANLLTDATLDSALKEFLMAWEKGGEPAALELARQRGLLDQSDQLRLTLVLDTNESDALVSQLEEIDVEIIAAYRNQVDIAVPLVLIRAQAQNDDLGKVFAHLSELEHVVSVRLARRSRVDATSATGEGVSLVGADTWHTSGFTGQKIKLGVLDLGFEGYQDLLGNELPEDVVFKSFGESPDPDERVHGTACAEIIHEMAPGAELYLVSYDGYFVNAGQAIEWLLEQNIDIISHSVGNSVGPRDGSSPLAVTVDEVTAQGVLWVNSAGNEAETHYRDAFADQDENGFHEFATDQEIMSLRRDPLALPDEPVVIVLNWDDWETVEQDYELLLLNQDGDELAASRFQQAGKIGDEPVEYLEYELPTDEVVYISIWAYDADKVVTFDLFVHNAEIEFHTPEHSLIIPADARGSLSVGAVDWWSDWIADYSSQGPTDDGRFKPDISAPTGVSNVTYEEFHGTSAAAPHVAGAAALVWSARPDLSRDELVDYLKENSLDLGTDGVDNVYGWGRLQLPDPQTLIPPSSTPTALAMPSPTTPPTAVATQPEPQPTFTLVPRPTATEILPSPTGPPTPVPTIQRLVTPSPAPDSSTETEPWRSSLLIIGAVTFGGGGILVTGALLGWIVYRSKNTSRSPGPVQSSPPDFSHREPPDKNIFRPPEPAQPPPPAWSRQEPSPDKNIFYPSEPAQPSKTAWCRHCGHSVKANAKFCPHCGQSLQRQVCSRCHSPLKSGARFCSVCGQAVKSAGEIRRCPSCGTALRPHSRFCPVCGQRVTSRQ